ncbi:MAG: cytochrome c biogenesis protein CcsA [Planctomycetota bacterium]
MELLGPGRPHRHRRPPALDVPLIGLLLDRLFKEPLYSGISAGLTLVGFIGSLFLPAQGYDVTPLVAILISPWREVHILSIMLSYAVLLVAAGLHLGFLLVLLIQPNARSVADGKVVYSALAGDLDRKAYLMVAWGFLLLTMGIATGAAWAHSSWGRYWGWDPKEVWATIAWAIYALFLHFRLFLRTRSELLAIISLIGFAAILFTYFGVTYLLSGLRLHAYA